MEEETADREDREKRERLRLQMQERVAREKEEKRMKNSIMKLVYCKIKTHKKEKDL